jgi:hypothetical protein
MRGMRPSTTILVLISSADIAPIATVSRAANRRSRLHPGVLHAPPRSLPGGPQILDPVLDPVLVSPCRPHPAPSSQEPIAFRCRPGCRRVFQGCGLWRGRLRWREQVLRLALPVGSLSLPVITLLPHIGKLFAQECNHGISVASRCCLPEQVRLRSNREKQSESFQDWPSHGRPVPRPISLGLSD